MFLRHAPGPWRVRCDLQHSRATDIVGVLVSYQTLTIEKRGQTDWVTLNRPDAFNTISPQMSDELQDYFGALYTDHSVRVVVLRGAGKHFCAGLDLKSGQQDEELSTGPAAGLRSQRRISEIVMRMRRCPQPIIGLVQGAASGGGFAFALACDVLIVGEGARMNVAMARIGMTGNDIGISYFLTRALPHSVANELMMTGRFLSAERAYQLGLASEICAPDALEAHGEAMAADMVRLSPMGLRLTKEGTNIARDAASLEAVVAMEDRQQILTTLSGDMKEGVLAFLEKRDPVYKD